MTASSPSLRPCTNIRCKENKGGGKFWYGHCQASSPAEELIACPRSNDRNALPKLRGGGGAVLQALGCCYSSGQLWCACMQHRWQMGFRVAGTGVEENAYAHGGYRNTLHLGKQSPHCVTCLCICRYACTDIVVFGLWDVLHGCTKCTGLSSKQSTLIGTQVPVPVLEQPQEAQFQHWDHTCPVIRDHSPLTVC